MDLPVEVAAAIFVFDSFDLSSFKNQNPNKLLERPLCTRRKLKLFDRSETYSVICERIDHFSCQRSRLEFAACCT